jgi:hypothetical protein
VEKTKHPGNGEEEDEAWEGWEIGSESSDDSSDSGGLIDVESGGEDHLDVSDSDDEDGKNGDKLRKDDRSAGDVNQHSQRQRCVEGLSSTSHSI